MMMFDDGSQENKFMYRGKMIGSGRTAEVYELGPDKVLKLFYEYTGETLNEYELGIGQAVYDAGVPAPKVYEKVQLMGRNGIVLEKAGGATMFRDIERRPWAIVHYARSMARLHARMHHCRSDKLLSQYEVIRSNINISADVLGERAEKIFDYLSGLPTGKSICHGDFHPKNIFTSARGYIAIDWADAYYGNQAGDVARTALILASPHVPADSAPILRLIMKQLKKQLLRYYLNEYLRLTPVSRGEINSWVWPVAAARLKENIPGEEAWLMDIIEGRTELLF